MSISFTIESKPVSASRPRVFRNGGRSYSKSHTEYEKFLMLYLQQYAPSQPIEGCISVEMEFVFTPLKTKTADFPRSDLDNLSKLPLDVMTKLGYWQDDSQVTKLTLSKRFCEKDEKNFTFVKISSIS